MNLIVELEKLRREHVFVGGVHFFSCAETRKWHGGPCVCGADKHNEQLDRIIKFLAEGVEG